MKCPVLPGLLGALCLLAACDSDANKSPAPIEPVETPYRASPAIAPVLPVPSPQQLAWQQMEMLMFVHFGLHTFAPFDPATHRWGRKDWGSGMESPDLFNPSALDTRQWARVAREAGFKGLIFTAKHHDGFALWPTEDSPYSVRSSPWKGGRGDVVAELARAVRAEGLKLGFYLSLWDMHEPKYGTPAYNAHYARQLEEISWAYGPVFEYWIDGACETDATSGCMAKSEYDMQRFVAIVKKWQPGALISISGTDVRWVGNESGVADEENWSINFEGPSWYPNECYTTNRPEKHTWFWHPDQEPPMSLERHLKTYFTSVGRNCVFMLNVPPDRAGRIPDEDVAVLHAFRAALDEMFAHDLAAFRPATASNVRAENAAWGARQALDSRPNTFWATDDSVQGAWLEVDLGRPQPFNVIELAEPIAYGQRVAAYRVEAMTASGWTEIARGTTVGYKKLDRPGTVTARRVRVVIERGRGNPALSRFGLYFSPLVPSGD